MTLDTLIATIRAQAPDMPHHLAASYLQEFVEKIRTNGKQDYVTLADFENEGYAIRLPEHVTRVEQVYVNGMAGYPTLTNNEARKVMHDHPTAIGWLDEDGISQITDEFGQNLEI